MYRQGGTSLESITQSIVDFFSQNNIPRELIIFLISMLPILELRGGLLAASLLGVPWQTAMLICFVGNILPIPFILLFIKKIFEWLKNTRFVKMIHRLEEKAAKKSKSIEKYKTFGLFLFVASPLPGTGAWTGALAASLMDMKLKHSIPSILLGVVGAGIIMAIVSYGVLGPIFH